MATTKALYGTDTAITITVNGLASAAARESSAIDNTSDLFLDALLYVAITLAAGTPSGGIDVYAYASEDGTNYTYNATGIDAALTMPGTTSRQFVFLGRINTATAGGLLWKQVFGSIASAFGGIVPPKWGIVIDNQTALAFSGAGNSVKYRGVNAQSL